MVCLRAMLETLANIAVLAGIQAQARVVRTSVGTYGSVASHAFGVDEFRDIPYALPPTGARRFLPPEPLNKSFPTASQASTTYAPACPQWVTSPRDYKSVWNEYFWYTSLGGINQTETGVSSKTSEDCLRLAIWVPSHAQEGDRLPVALFFPGGGFTSGGVDVPVQNPAGWVSRSQNHIVVTANYRLGIFGFGNARGAAQKNAGILDQRQALKWVAEHIFLFGGDPDRITIWGQSAGAQSVDFHAFAWPDNLLAQGIFAQSGVAVKPQSFKDVRGTNFTSVALGLGCSTATAKSELKCMQKASVSNILTWVAQHGGDLHFGPTPDGETIFDDYADRMAQGRYAKVPIIISNAANEEASLVAFPSDTEAGPDPTTTNEETMRRFICPSAKSSSLRHQTGRITYRYQYAERYSDFENQLPRAWLAAAHSSDLGPFFGTYDLTATGAPTNKVTKLARHTAHLMQDHLLAFLKDPYSGPPSLGWHSYVYPGRILRFGADGKAIQSVSGSEIDGPCRGVGTYNPHP